MLKKLLAWLDNYFSQDEKREIKKLKSQLRECRQFLNEEREQFAKTVEVLKIELVKTKERLDILRKMVFGAEKAPKPKWLKKGKCYLPRKEVLRKDGKVEWISIPKEDMYFPTPTIRKLVEQQKWLQIADRDKRLMKIWDFVIRNLKYVYDYIENWQFPIESISRKKADCEDGTILFVTLCRASGIGDVFNVCGMVDNKYGHSYPIAKMSDGKWYIFETTLDRTPKKPMEFFNQSHYDARWGMHNWKHEGVLDKTKVKGLTKARTGGKIKINNGKEKAKAIRRLWK